MKYSEELIKELGNAIAAYGCILRAAALKCEVPSKFEAFKNLPEEDLLHRIKLLSDFYNEIKDNS